MLEKGDRRTGRVDVAEQTGRHVQRHRLVELGLPHRLVIFIPERLHDEG